MPETAEDYTRRMLALLGEQNPMEVQQQTPEKLAGLIELLTEQQLTTRPAPDRWSIAEVLAHLADTELVLGWRMRLILASNGAALQNVDQDAWADALGYARQAPEVSLNTFGVLREANLTILRSLPTNSWDTYGVHQERGKETLAHIVRMYAAHDLSHLMQIEKIRAAYDNLEGMDEHPLERPA